MYSDVGRGRRGNAPCESAKLLKRLKTAMGGYWKKLAWIWVWRHSRLGLAPRPYGVGAIAIWGGPRRALA
jgi:hypothetical protein